MRKLIFGYFDGTVIVEKEYLAAIVVLRTSLNYILERELKNNEGQFSERPKEAIKSK